MKKWIVVLNFILVVVILLMIINHLMMKLVSQEQTLQVCELQKKEMREAYSDLYYYYNDKEVNND